MQDYLINVKSRRRAGASSRASARHCREHAHGRGARSGKPVLAGGAVVTREHPTGAPRS